MESFVTTDDGVRLWASVTGHGDPVVLCHGGPGLWDMMAGPAAALAGSAAVCRWDQRGCGRSSGAGPYTVERAVADFDAVRAWFGWSRVVLLGHSWGAQLALRYALAHPCRVGGLVYVAGTGIDADETWHDEFVRNLRRGLGAELARWESLRGRGRTTDEEREFAVLQWSAEFVDRARAGEHAAAMADPWFPVNYEANRLLGDDNRRDLGTAGLREACAALRVPALIVDGAADLRPRAAVDSLERALPMVSRVRLERASHLPWVEDPAGFQAAAEGFLREVGTGS